MCLHLEIGHGELKLLKTLEAEMGTDTDFSSVAEVTPCTCVCVCVWGGCHSSQDIPVAAKSPWGSRSWFFQHAAYIRQNSDLITNDPQAIPMK